MTRTGASPAITYERPSIPFVGRVTLARLGRCRDDRSCRGEGGYARPTLPR